MSNGISLLQVLTFFNVDDGRNRNIPHEPVDSQWITPTIIWALQLAIWRQRGAVFSDHLSIGFCVSCQPTTHCCCVWGPTPTPRACPCWWASWWLAGTPPREEGGHRPLLQTSLQCLLNHLTDRSEYLTMQSVTTELSTHTLSHTKLCDVPVTRALFHTPTGLSYYNSIII